MEGGQVHLANSVVPYIFLSILKSKSMIHTCQIEKTHKNVNNTPLCVNYSHVTGTPINTL